MYYIGPKENPFSIEICNGPHVTNTKELGKFKITKQENQVHEANLLKLDISKSVDQLKWKPCLTAQETIEWTIGWYKNRNSYGYTLQQINKYQQL